MSEVITYRVSHIEMSEKYMVPKGGKINNFVDFSLKAYSGALGI
jgi:hypothetical protein